MHIHPLVGEGGAEVLVTRDQGGYECINEMLLIVVIYANDSVEYYNYL